MSDKIKPVMMVRRALHDDAGQVFDCLVPVPRFAELFRRQYPEGDSADHQYPMVPVEPRNMKMHGHYFATLNQMYENLPDHVAKRFPSVEHLRAWALVQTGFCDERSIICDDQTMAQRLAAFIRTTLGLAVITIGKADNDPKKRVVHVFTPKSQSVALMSAEEFKASKDAVLDLVESLNPNVTRRAAEKEANRYAPRKGFARA